MAPIGVLNSLGVLRRVQERIAALRRKATAQEQGANCGARFENLLMFPGPDASGPQPA